jgi:NAD(P)H-dependent flavin oxidoreductase YrpB (nitropropane dioxygenase family)
MSIKDKLKEIVISGARVLPLVEGGKGIAATDGLSAGSWAAMGGVGTISAVNPHIPGTEKCSSMKLYSSCIRLERHKEMIERAIAGGIAQARIAYETACRRGRIHINVLWEMGGVEEILHGILSKVKGMVHGVTCGAGMPFRLGEICAKYDVQYYPIVSSARAFSILWKRAYNKFSQWLGGVVYEDPWLAGGHNGLSTNEDETLPEPPEPRVKELWHVMRSFGLTDLMPIFMAGGVWCLSEWADWINNPDLGAIAFQFGTRPLLTQESPIPMAWKKKLLTLKRGDVVLNRFSPTGFPSSAVQNNLLINLQQKSARQVPFSALCDATYTQPFSQSPAKPPLFLAPTDYNNAMQWVKDGFDVVLKTPSKTIIFVTKDENAEIMQDRLNCVGCLSACKFSGWSQDADRKVKIVPDPRSFCIQKSLQLIAMEGEVENALMFCGHQGYRFAEDEFYKDGRIPTVKELVERLQTGL